MKRIAVLAVALASIAAAARAQPSCNVLPQNTLLTLLPRGADRQSPNLTISFGAGAPMVVQIDTGSTGIAVWDQRIPKPWTPATDVTIPPIINYNSSNRTLYGQWLYTSVTITGANGRTVQIDRLPVLGVDRVECPSGCSTPAEQQAALRGLGMMGVGFDRGPNMGLADENPFLHIRQMEAGTMQRAYVITNDSVTFGLPPDLSGFAFVPLARLPGQWSWQQAQGCVQLSGGGIDEPFGPVCGNTLMDTGVSHMFISYDPALRPAFGGRQVGTIPAGTTVTVSWPHASAPAFRFEFDVPSDWTWTTPAPQYVAWGPKPADTAIFVNTSRQLLWAADYLYDATCGRIGFRPRAGTQRRGGAPGS